MATLKPRMTLQVIRVNRAGRVLSKSGVREFYDGSEDGTATTSPVSVVKGGFPPCQCPHCRRFR
ncbi:hypothetical protein GCM10009601_27330 [Streptomyces thermospinosisporus]|uniref:Uncharacterized protein n=1 Tax=Streptomyces thermospinosisporus TaxID=161482 RepID=A0ABN1YVV3_9ACTN